MDFIVIPQNFKETKQLIFFGKVTKKKEPKTMINSKTNEPFTTYTASFLVNNSVDLFKKIAKGYVPTFENTSEICTLSLNKEQHQVIKEGMQLLVTANVSTWPKDDGTKGIKLNVKNIAYYNTYQSEDIDFSSLIDDSDDFGTNQCTGESDLKTKTEDDPEDPFAKEWDNED